MNLHEMERAQYPFCASNLSERFGADSLLRKALNLDRKAEKKWGERNDMKLE